MVSQVLKVNNPQGKGIVGVVDDLRAITPINVQAKNSHQWLADYFTSTLVLGAKYGFKPVIEKTYYLYLKDQEWRLSLIEPQAWRSQDSGLFFSECILNKDMSWSLKLASNWQEHEALLNTVNKLEQEFFECINDEVPVVEKLPFFIQHLSYYQRLGANALARSLKQSLEIKMGENNCNLLTGNSLIADITNTKIRLLEATG